MTDGNRVLAISGSARPGSLNSSLLQVAAAGARKAGASVTQVSLSDIEMPLFDAHLLKQKGFPESVVRFKQLMKSHDGLLISSPEYNSSVAAPMKNAIDWASRTMDGEGWKECFVGKTAAIMGASTGALGGLKGLLHLREILSAMHVLVIPQQMTLGKADTAFASDGSLRDPDLQARAEALGAELERVLDRVAT